MDASSYFTSWSYCACVVSDGGQDLPAAYAAWQNRLASAFLEDLSAPVLMYVDDAELVRLAGSETAAAELAAAVQLVADYRDGAAMFNAAERWSREWVAGARDVPPPTLPILALSVLAATRMRRQGLVRATNFYIRMAEVVAPAASEAVRADLQARLKRDLFLPVVTMWQQLHDWIETTSGIVGISTIHDHPHNTRIGYPLSQALLRASDRAALTRFFDALDIDQLGVPAPPALLKYLRLWVSRPRGLSESFVAAVNDDDLLALLQPLITALATTWDGHIVAADGAMRLPIALALDFERWTAKWLIEASRLQGSARLTGRVRGQTVEVDLESDEYSVFGRVTGALPLVVPDLVRDGWRLGSERVVAEFTGGHAIAFREHQDSPGWVSVESVEPYATHVVVGSSENSADLHRMLTTAADPGWRLIPQPQERLLLPGFSIYYGVSFSNPDLLNQALAASSDLLRSVIRPSTTARPRLTNGLPLARAVGRNHYIVGGEPDLLLPVGGSPRSVPTALDGVSQSPPFMATGFPIPLRRIGPLQPGDHQLDADGDLLRFVMLEEEPWNRSASLPEAAGWTSDGVFTSDSAQIVVSGARCATAPDEPCLLYFRRGATRPSLICDRDGNWTEVVEPPPVIGPVADTAGIGGYRFEAAVPRTTVWRADWVRARGGRWFVRPVNRLGPQFARLTSLSRLTWEAVATSDIDDELWPLYLRAWEGSRGR